MAKKPVGPVTYFTTSDVMWRWLTRMMTQCGVALPKLVRWIVSWVVLSDQRQVQVMQNQAQWDPGPFPNSVFNVRLSAGQRAKVDRLARLCQRSRSAIVRRCLQLAMADEGMGWIPIVANSPKVKVVRDQASQ